MSQKSSVPSCTDIWQANLLLSCLVPIAGGDPIQIPFASDFSDCGEQDIHDVAALLSTACVIGADVTEDLVAAFGGEQTLFTWFHSQTPWVTAPIIEPEGTHGRTVRANWFLIAESHQTDPHETICDICETLIAVSPTAAAAASDAIDPLGRPIAIGEFRPWSKNIPRANLPSKARVAWNVAFRQILLARATAHSLTEYTLQMARYVMQTERLFRLFSEKWIKSKHISNMGKLADQINDVVRNVSSLNYAKPESPGSSMTSPKGDAGVNDTLGALLTGILGNLVPRMGEVLNYQNAKAAATFAGSLAEQAREHHKSDIWRTTASPPLGELAAIAVRLDDVACILHEIAHDHTATAIKRLHKPAKKSRLGKAVHAVAGRCRSMAEQRFRRKLGTLENALKALGWTVRCWTRPVNEKDSVYWPAAEVAILVKINNFETDSSYLDDCLSTGAEQLEQDWPFRIVPVIDSQVIASLAFAPSSRGPLPDEGFAHKWQAYIDLPFLSSVISDAFDAAVAACVQISAIISCCDLTNLHLKEKDVLLKAIDNFNSNSKTVDASTEKRSQDIFDWASAYLDEMWDQVLSEFESMKTGRMVDNPLSHVMSNEKNEKVVELGIARILLRQAECLAVAAK